MSRSCLVVLALLAGLAAIAGCGGGGSTGSPGGDAAAVVESVATITQPGTAAPPGSIRALLDETPGEDVGLVLGSSDFAVGDNRVSFLVVSSDGQVLDGSTARVLVAAGGLEAQPTIEATASDLTIGASETGGSGGDDFDVQSVWVARLSLPKPGRYTLLVEPTGAAVQAVGQIDVAARSAAPAVGSRAIPSDTPTLADGFPDEITTATPPDTNLLRYSVRQSIVDRVPFVVTFATPKYCQSRVCGPVVDVVEKVRKGFERSGVRFIHVEIYEHNDPSRGFNRWVKEWNLPTEPYTFVVDGEGVIRARFEGLVTASELEQAVREYLL